MAGCLRMGGVVVVAVGEKRSLLAHIPMEALQPGGFWRLRREQRRREVSLERWSGRMEGGLEADGEPTHVDHRSCRI